MSKQKQSAAPAATKTQQKPAPTPTQELVATPEMDSVLGLTGAASYQSSAQRLGNPNLPRIQRQMMAGRIGQVQGNGHLQSHYLRIIQRRNTPDQAVAMQLIEGEYNTMFQDVEIIKTETSIKTRAWEESYRNAGSAFATAVHRHQDACSRAEREAQADAAILASLLSIICTGLSSYGSTMSQVGDTLSSETDNLLNISEDVFQITVDKTLPLVIGESRTEEQSLAVGEIPLVFQNNYMNQVSAAHRQILGNLVRIMRLISSAQRSARVTLAANFSEEIKNSELENIRLIKNRIEDDLLKPIRESLLFTTDPPAIERNQMANEFERGLWARWVPRLVHQPAVIAPTPVDLWQLMFDHYASPGTPVEDRLDVLGITSEAGIGEFGSWTSDAEVEKLVNWGTNYQPQELIPTLGS